MLSQLECEVSVAGRQPISEPLDERGQALDECCLPSFGVPGDVLPAACSASWQRTTECAAAACRMLMVDMKGQAFLLERREQSDQRDELAARVSFA